MFHIFTNNARNDKHALLEKLYLQYRNLMFHIAFKILNDHGLAEDAVHAAFIKLAKSSFVIDEISSNKTKTFMVIVTRSTACDICRQNKKERNLVNIDDDMLELIDEKPLPLDFIIDTERIEKVHIALATMDPKYADVVLLKYFYGHSNANIGLLTGISEQTVRVRLYRAKKMLADKLVKGDIDHE